MSNELVPYADIEKMGTAISKSGLFGVKTPEQAIALMLIAQAQGMHPANAAMVYHIIQGRPAKKSEAIQADFLASGGSIKWISLTDEKAEAEFSHPKGGTLKLDWTIDRAKKACLYDKDGSMYKKYPRQMLKARLIAEGVRAIWPAAMGGVTAVEEVEDIEEVKGDPSKSRIENIVEAQTTAPSVETPNESPKVEEPKKKKAQKVAEDAEIVPAKAKTELPEGVHEVIGLIEEIPKTATVMNPKTNKPELKHSFKIADKFYGTFDNKLAKGIMELVDQRVMIKIQYTERHNSDKTKVFNDIVSFSAAAVDEVLPV